MKVGEKKLQIGNRCLTIKTKKIMKKNLFMVAAVALIATVSCNKEEFRNNDAQGVASDVVFVAELEQPGDDVEVAAPAAAQTKTALGSTTNGVTAVNWVGNEKVSINGVEFTTTSTGAKATFTTTKTFDKTAAKFDAIYPASAGTALTAVTIPASQKGTFAEAAISVATSTTTSLNFKNLASIIKFQVPSACSTITITSTANLAGTFPVTFENGLPKIGTVTNTSKTITVAGSFKTGTDYYVAVLPGSHKFTVRLDGYLSKASTTAVTTTRAKIANLQELPAPEASTWVIVGAYNSWKNDATAKKLYKDISGFVVKNITLNGEFKMINGSKWLSTMVPSAAQNKWCLLKENMANMTRSSGTYDIWISSDGKEVCVVNSGSSAPQLNDSNRQYYIVLQHNWDWANRRLHAWIDNGSDATNVNLMGAWPGKAANGTFTYDNNGYSYWEIPNSVYGKKLGIIFSNNGGEQTQNKYFTNYRDDKRFWLEWKDPNRIANEF